MRITLGQTAFVLFVPIVLISFNNLNLSPETDQAKDQAAIAATANSSDMHPNLRAFIDGPLSLGEGTMGEKGYRKNFGGAYFDDFSEHPRNCVEFFNKATGRKDCSTAAGKGQFVATRKEFLGSNGLPLRGRERTWDRLKRELGLPDFSPASQDKAIVALLKEEGAYDDVIAGRIRTAIVKTSNVWASFPNELGVSAYQQDTEYTNMSRLLRAYIQAGGTLSEK